MDLDSLRVMMFQHHYMVANSGDHFKHNVSIKNEDLRKPLPLTNTEFDELVKASFAKFHENRGRLGIGTVDYNPAAWVQIAILTIDKAVKNEDSIICFPNGCCALPRCPINILYEAVVDECFCECTKL
jgi:hypothetical protein